MLFKNKAISRLMAAVALIALPAMALGQSYYDDDIYYNGDKAEKEQKAKKQAKTTTKKSTSLGDYGYYQYNTVDYPGADAYIVNSGSTRDIDEYNRRGQFLVADTLVADTTYMGDTFANTRRIERFHNSEVVSGSGDDLLQEYYYTSEPTSTVNIYVNNDPWYNPYWSWSWRYGSPWYYNTLSWGLGWYDPWYSPSWAWGWGPSWNWGWGWNWGWNWGWGPSWYPGGGWYPGHGGGIATVPNNGWGNRRPGAYNGAMASQSARGSYNSASTARPGQIGSFGQMGNRRNAGTTTRINGSADTGNRRVSSATSTVRNSSSSSTPQYNSNNRRSSSSSSSSNSSYGNTRSSSSSSSYGSSHSSSSSSSFGGGSTRGGGGGGFSGGGGGGGRRR